MAVCLDYQTVYLRRERVVISLRTQIAAGLLLLVTLGFKVWVKLETIDLGYEMAKERDQMLAFDMERRELELQRSLLLRPDALARAAATQLHLRPLNPQQIIKVRY